MTAAIRFVIGVALAVLLLALFPVDVYAQKVALLHADNATRASVVRGKLIAAGLADVTVIDVGSTGTTPTLADLQQYHAILTYSLFGYANRTALGNTLADYVDLGGGVVQAACSFDFGDPSPGGRWESEQYSVFTQASCESWTDLILVADDSAHPIMNGTTFSPGMNFHSPSFVDGSSQLLAHWDNGYPAVAVRPGPLGGKIAGLNFFPVFGNGGQLMAKALQFVAAEFIPNPDGPAVALLAAGGASAGANDVRSKLRSLTLFSRVDVIDVSASAVPSLTALLPYDAVLTWSSSPYGNPAGLGDVLADYVDQNRGVVEAAFSTDTTAGMHLEGRWSADGYRPLTLGVVPPPPPVPLTLLPVLPLHAMLSGVASFNGGTSSIHSVSVLDAATTLVASWSNGQPLAAFGTKSSGGRTVALNMYPPSSDAEGDLWDRTTDGARLMANALVFAANHFPTADAGLDQTGAATSPAGVSFTLTAAGSDLDGDALSYNWSGAVTAPGQSIVVTVPPPPAPQQSHSVTVTVTVADGKGGETSDSVELTVTDLVAPVLQNMPSGVITAEATSDSGANVAYGPVTATDAVDGAVSVSCSQSGVFPIGDTVVTCSASDSRGNTTSQSFTVRVTRASDPEPPANTPGRVHGYGFVRNDDQRTEFAFSAMENTAGAESGSLLVTVKTSNGNQRRTDNFAATTVSSLMFGRFCTVVFGGTGRWNGVGGYRYRVAAADNHNQSDLVRITITSPSGEVVAQAGGKLEGGNVHVFHNF
jgi:HYR domain-containing protein/Big-like domain-containing protein